MQTQTVKPLGTKVPGVQRTGNSYSEAPPPIVTERKPYQPILQTVQAGQPDPKQTLLTVPTPVAWKDRLGYKDGGEVKDRPKLAAKKGPVTGPGTATSDSIPAKLSKGEFIIPAAIVKQYGKAFFNKLIGGTKEPDTDDKGRPKLAQGGGLSDAEKIRIKSLIAPVNDSSPDNTGLIKNLPQSKLTTQNSSAYPSLNKQTFMPDVYPKNKAFTTGSGLGTQGIMIPPDLNKDMLQLPKEQPATIPEQPSSTGFDVNGMLGQQIPFPKVNLGDPNRAGQVKPQQQQFKPTQVINRPAGNEYRNDLGNGNYIGASQQKTAPKVDRMRALMTPSTDAQKQNRAEQAKIVDDRYAWAGNKEAERQQAQRTAQQDQMTQQANNTLLAPTVSGDLLGMVRQKHDRAAAGEFLNQNNNSQQIQANNRLGLGKLATDQAQFDQTMGYNKEAAKNAGTLKAEEMAQEKELKTIENTKPVQKRNVDIYAEGVKTGEEPGGLITYDPATKTWGSKLDAGQQTSTAEQQFLEAHRQAAKEKDPAIKAKLIAAANAIYHQT